MANNIKTLAFFDIETTGLPSKSDPAKITELSIVAIPFSTFENFNGNCLRVKHKLSLCFNPEKIIGDVAVQLSGLTNELLQEESRFDESTMRLLEDFFEHLQKPICLVAHNGDRFDFKILMQYYKKLSFPVQNCLKCCDSLKIFKEIIPRGELQSMKLVDIYFHFFRSEPVGAHEAEADVMMLIKCVEACKHEFIQKVQKMKLANFTDIQP